MSNPSPPPNGESVRLLEVIRTQAEIVKLGLDLGSVMTLVASRAQLLTGAQGAVVELAEGDEMVYQAATGIAEPHLGLRLQRGDSISGMCVRDGKPLRCDDTENDPRVNIDACRKIGLRSMIVVPLIHHDSAVGVLKVLSKSCRAFSEADLYILGLMSEVIAASMYNATQDGASELFYRATHDLMTGIANRALFFDRLRHCLSQAQRERRRVGIITLDMDGLKPVNDQLGHRAGDAAIQEFAARLKLCSRNSDTVARLGGDEFGVILTRVDARDGAIIHADRIAEHIAEPYDFEGQPLALGASMGCVIFPDDGQDLTTLLDKADQAMYRMKRLRKARDGVRNPIVHAEPAPSGAPAQQAVLLQVDQQQ
jgi:diguanylate cyclase (GGDEF)-like protein